MKRRRAARTLAFALCAAMLTGSLAACGGKNSGSTGNTGNTAGTENGSDSSSVPDTSGKSTDFTMLAVTAITADQYTDYNEYPVTEWWLDHEWDAKGDGNATKINVDIWAPTSGSESDYVNTLIATGEYPDLMNLQFASESAGQLYEDGWTLDLTDYVKAYMPNYLAWLDEHPEVIATNEVDGEQRYIQIYSGNKDLGEPWGGLVYRRDWIVNYGTNPETGEPFHGEWVENEDGTKDWVDDVVFPSGNTDPLYISDWEWMFNIFSGYLQGLAANGVDGYCMQLPYQGALLTGDLLTGFGGIGGGLYLDENGNVAFGATSEGMRAYTECITNWYKNGWIDPGFAERAGDMFFMIDSATIYTGACGLWYGLQSQLLDGLAGDGSNPLTANAVVYACPSPINDVYGDDSVQNVKPTTYYAGSYLGCSWVLTDKAEDKDIASLLTALDYFYSDKGSMVFCQGLSDQMMAAANGDEDWYQKYVDLGLPNGAYTIGEDGIPVRDQSLIYDNENRYEAAVGYRLCGCSFNTAEKGYSDTMKQQLTTWMMYEDSGQIQNDITSQLSAEDATAHSTMNSDFQTAVAQWLPQYIMGTYDVTDDAAWDNFCAEIDALDWQSSQAALQAVIDNAR